MHPFSPDGEVTVAASVATGLEPVAALEIKDKILSTDGNQSVITKQGRVYFDATKDDLPLLHSLRSVDRLYLVVYTRSNYVYPDSKEEALADLHKLANLIQWDNIAKFWRYNLPYLKEKSTQKDLGKYSPTPKKLKQEKVFDDPIKAHINNGNALETSPKNDCVDIQSELVVMESLSPRVDLSDSMDETQIRFRVSTNRVGKAQPITSPEASYQFGGEIQNITNWKVDLVKYNLEILLCLGEASLEVTLALNLQSLHRRNITHFGITTLRATTAFNMLQLCDIQPGDVVIDPMCGSGALPIEGALEWPKNYFISGDIVKAAINRCQKNVQYLDQNPTFAMKVADKEIRKNLPVDFIKWDVTMLPLKSDFVDVIVSDLPFGKRIGSKSDNRKLYPSLLQETARVAKRETGRACLLTQDKRTMIRSLNGLTELWKLKRTIYINIGGLTAGLFLLKRTKALANT